MKNTNRKRSLNKLNLVISVLLSFAAWLYVMYNVDPAITKTYRDIPVKISGVTTLENNGLVIRETEFETVDVTIEAKRSMLSVIENGGITVSVDASDASRGENKFALDVKTPGDVKVESKSHDSITIIVDTMETKDVGVNVNVENPDDLYYRTWYASDYVTIRGYGTELAEIEEVETEKIDLKDVTESTELELKFILPEGVELDEDSQGETLSVSVTPRTEGTFVLTPDMFNVTGLSDKFDYEITDNVEISVIGTEEERARTSTDDFTITVDLSGVNSAGDTKAEVKMETEVPRSELITKELEVRITQKEQD